MLCSKAASRNTYFELAQKDFLFFSQKTFSYLNILYIIIYMVTTVCTVYIYTLLMVPPSVPPLVLPSHIKKVASYKCVLYYIHVNRAYTIYVYCVTILCMYPNMYIYSIYIHAPSIHPPIHRSIHLSVFPYMCALHINVCTRYAYYVYCVYL